MYINVIFVSWKTQSKAEFVLDFLVNQKPCIIFPVIIVLGKGDSQACELEIFDEKM